MPEIVTDSEDYMRKKVQSLHRGANNHRMERQRLGRIRAEDSGCIRKGLKPRLMCETIP